MRIDHPGLYHDLPIGKVNLENVVHARQADDDAARRRKRTPAETRSRTATHKRNSVPST